MARVFIGIDDKIVAPALGNGDRNNLGGKLAVLLRSLGLVLGPQCELVLVLAGDLVLDREVFRGLAHGVDAVEFFHLRVHEAPADGGVIYFRLAGKRLVGLGHHEGGAAHAFDAAGNCQVRLAHANGAGRLGGGFHARSAQPVDGGAAGFHRNTCQQARHTGDVPVVLARLVGIAEIDIVHLCPVDRRVTVHQRLDRHCAEVVGANPAQTAAIAADGCADGVTDESVRHVFESLFQKDAHCCR